jgi:predicted porin
MKKLLIATAALAMVAGTAQAQSSVTVYGVIDTGYNSRENTSNANVKTESVGISGGTNSNVGEAASNRIGFRGTEDLGGGLKANFVVESGMGQNAAFTVGGRAFWAGLQDAKMGELRIGRQDTFARTNWLSHDQLAFANVAGNLAHSDAQGDASTTSHTNRSVAVNYLSPRMSGVQLSLGMTQDDTEASNANKTKNGSGAQAGLSYVAGKFSAGVAYVEATTSVNAANATVFKDTAGANTTTVNAAAVTAADTKTKDTSAAASYDLGVAKVAYIYNKREADNRLSTSTGDNERTSHAFSASIPMGAKLIGRVGYGFGEYRTGATTAYKGDLKGMQAALNYNLSKRTMVYGIYGDEKREDSATTQIKTKEYSVGVRHTF